jgi:drug/metabolite transporter (DMT)-like permease
MPQSNRSSILALTVAHILINSGGYLFVKVGLSEFSPFAFAFWRFVIGLSGLGFIIHTRKAWPKVDRGDWPRFFLLAFLAVPMNQLLYLTGMRYTVPSHASLIYGSTAIIALILSVLLKVEKLRWLKGAAIALALTGLILVVTESPTPILGTENFAGDILIAISMLAWASYTVLGKPIVMKYGAIPATLVCLILGSFMGLPFLIGPALSQNYALVTWRGWIGTAYAGIMVTTISYVLWFTLLKRVDPSQVAIITTPQPIVATTLSVLILGETVGVSLIVGGLFVISGVILMQAPALLNRAHTQRG